jgi:hypothetical protein
MLVYFVRRISTKPEFKIKLKVVAFAFVFSGIETVPSIKLLPLFKNKFICLQAVILDERYFKAFTL